MPRYRYECTQCGDLIIAFHSFEETFSDCEKCKQPNTMQRILSTPLTINKKSTGHPNKKVGELTKEYIEENRKILEQQKKEATRKANDSS